MNTSAITKPVSFKIIRVLFLVLLYLLVFGCSPGTQPTLTSLKAGLATDFASQVQDLSNSGIIAHISDIHFNPFYDPKLLPGLIEKNADQWEAVFLSSTINEIGTAGSDSNFNLFKSALANIALTAKNGRNPDFIIFTGDYLSHDFNETFAKYAPPGSDINAFIKKDFEFLVWMFNKYFHGVPVYITLGNEDSYQGNYKLTAKTEFLKDTASIFSKRLMRLTDDNAQRFLTTYPEGGYYALTMPASNSVLISVNSVFFSSNKDDLRAIIPAALKQLDWLQQQLQQALVNKQKVWLITHIPPGNDTYYSQKKDQYIGFWQEEYSRRFMKLMTAYAPIITAGFAGHSHKDDFRLLPKNKTPADGLVFFHIAPAISPVYYNNPAYLLMRYQTETSTLIDYDAYYLNLAKPNTLWAKEYNFRNTYRQSAITASGVYKIFQQLGKTGAVRNAYMHYYNSGYTAKPAIDSSEFQLYLCSMIFWMPLEFNTCMATSP